MYLGLNRSRRGGFFPHAAATKTLVFSTEPVGAASGSNFATQPVVTAKLNGVTDTSFSGNVTVALNALTGSPTLTGTVTVAAVAGVATFTNLGVTGGASTETLTASAAGYSSATSSTVTTTSGGFTALFDFRATAPFVTDPAGASPVLAETYPHTYGNGAVAGWVTEGAVQARDRNATLDPRLAGANFDDTQANSFRLDGLVAGGVYDVRLAMGDPNSAQVVGVTAMDGATTLFTIAPTSIAAGHVVDAHGTDLTDAAWPAGNVAQSVTMAGTSLALVFPAISQNVMQHLSVVRTA